MSRATITSGLSGCHHVAPARPLRTDYDFDVAQRAVQRHFAANVAAHGVVLFTTNADNLFETYLRNLPPAYRQEHTCNECRRFIERFGGLVLIKEDGSIVPAMWDDKATRTGIYQDAIRAMFRAVATARVTGVFVSSEKNLGNAVTGQWHHFAVQNPSVWTSRVSAAHEQAALKLEHFGTLNRALADFSEPVVAGAVTLLESNSLYRSEKVRGPARFLLDLILARKKARSLFKKQNLVWRAVATAPAGFCTPRSSMIGTLLEDILAGHSFESAAKRFKAKMNPLQYQRPQAAPKLGNVAQADQLFTKLGLESAMRRRFARLEEVPLIWKPRPKTRQSAYVRPDSIFSRLQPAAPVPVRAALNTTPVPITFSKFERTVLPTALWMEVNTSSPNSNYGALVTAVDPKAEKLFQWDNPFSWYVYSSGSTPKQWALPPAAWVAVDGIALQPSMMDDRTKFAHQGQAAFFILHGARDQRGPGLAIFPETLRADLHSVRSTIERFSKTGRMEGAGQATACGLIVGRAGNTLVRVETAAGVALYSIDRFD